MRNKLENSKKIVVLGSSGSGKSTMAKKLSKNLNIPVYYYDQIRWLKNWDKPKDEKIIADLKEITKHGSYVFEGTYSSKMSDIIDDCDIIIVLAIPTYLCTYRIFKRTFLSFITGKKGAREDLPKGCNEKLGVGYLRFIKYTLTYNNKLQEMYKDLEQYKNKLVILKKNIK